MVVGVGERFACIKVGQGKKKKFSGFGEMYGESWLWVACLL